MIWSSFAPSHHCIDTTLSVLSVCNNKLESPHLLAIGSDLGTVDIVNLEKRTSVASYDNLHDDHVLDVEFYTDKDCISHDKNAIIHLNIETSNRSVLYEQRNSIQCITLSNYTSNDYQSRSSPILASTKTAVLNFDLRTPDPITLMKDQQIINELCLLPDEYTILGLQNNYLCVTDFRKPEKFHSLNFSVKFEKLSCNSHYLSAVTSSSELYTFELPVDPQVCLNHSTYENPIISRASFCDDYVVVGNESGMILFVNPASIDDIDMIQCPISTPIVSVSSSFSEITVSFEDEIYVYSEFPFEDNLLRPLGESDDDEFVFDDRGNIVTRSAADEATASDKNWLCQNEDVKLEDGECSYERYGYCEQQIFVCFTCSRDANRPIGVCEQCSIICHDGHDVRPIGIRRRFRCDCGNNRCPQFCKAMFEPKVTENTFNRYNHNFQMRWCSCDGPDVPPMVQCICCDDWFHHECIGFFSEKRCLIVEEVKCLANWVFVCSDCLASRMNFLNEFDDAKPPDEIAEFVREMQIDSGITPFDSRKEAEDSSEAAQNPENESLEQFKNRIRRQGIGFSILGGKWLPKDLLFKFKGDPQFDKEFEKIDPTEEDKLLPISFRQKEIGSFMKKAYEDIFRMVSEEGRTVIQKSDTEAVLGKNASELLMERRRSYDHDDDNGNNDDNDGNTV